MTSTELKEDMQEKGGANKENKVRKDKTFHFISGLPRAGSTLLANILSQNPRFSASHTSGILDVLFATRNNWDKLIEFKAHPDETAKLRVLRSILGGYYSNIEEEVVFDKSRGWLSQLGMAESILGRKAKVLVPVRDIRDVLASFEKLWRQTSETKQVVQEQEHYFQFQTVQGRCEVWLRPEQPVGLAYNRLKDAINRGYSDRMYLIDFNDLTNSPKRVMDSIYKFLGEEPFEHNFDHVEQVTWEDDSMHGFENLHTIRPKVEPMPEQWPKVLGKGAEQYGKLNFWKKS
ncbi:MAG: sulfotransferase [Candidatus Paceibacterota bacterium]